MLTHTSGATIAAVGLSTTHEDDLARQGGNDGLRVHLQAHLRHGSAHIATFPAHNACSRDLKLSLLTAGGGGVHQAGVAQVVEPVGSEDLAAGLEPHCAMALAQ